MTAQTLVTAPTGTARLFAASAPSFDAHLAAFGPLPSLEPSRFLAEAEASGLAGRGGAGFPTWRKLAATRGVRRAVVIANGSEGEPASAKDATLMTVAPHLVLDGLALAAQVVGADELHLHTNRRSAESMRAAIAQRTDAAAHVRLSVAPDAFIAGEASAVVSAIGGGPAVPRDHPVRLAVAGLRGRPTLVQNVETLAHLALIARYGGDWFRSAGAPDDPGTRLLSVSASAGAAEAGAGVRVLEASGGIRIGDALASAGVDPASLSAVLVGGYHGAWVPREGFDLPLTAAALTRFGAVPGAGILVGLREGTCGLGVTASILEYLAGSSAGQCGPCANGLPRLAETVRALARGDATASSAETARLAEVVTGRGACHHPDGTARLAVSAMRTFAADVHAHRNGRCLA